MPLDHKLLVTSISSIYRLAPSSLLRLKLFIPLDGTCNEVIILSLKSTVEVPHIFWL